MRQHPTAYLSPSRLSCYAYCPAEFYQRYILKILQPPTVEMMFGSAVHAGLEARFLGHDDDLAFLKTWRAARLELEAAGNVVGSGLVGRGLDLLNQVRDLELSGEPERRIGVIASDIPLPFIGYVDLWADGHIYDFKTTRQPWTQEKADAQIFQPAIYSQAYSDEHGIIPQFTFVVLSRTAGPMQLLDGTRTGDQIIAAFARAREIYDLIEGKVFDCSCGKHDDLEPAA